MTATVSLYNYTVGVNRKLKRLFESIQYQDFAITFRADNDKGSSFADLNKELNEVIKSFNQVRAERESIIHFIQAIIQQINVGILSYNPEGKVELSNQAIHKLLSLYKISHVNDIAEPEVFQTITQLSSGQSKLIHVQNNDLSIAVKEIILRDRRIRLVTVHNIKSELQNRELEAWQNLTKVLRHEIMNSVTPIVSLSETMAEIIEYDFTDVTIPKHKMAIIDLKQAIGTITARSRGIMHFVNAYREFTNVPQPILRDTNVEELVDQVSALFEGRSGDGFSIDIKQNFSLLIDMDQVAQVLINLIKNGYESAIPGQNVQVELVAELRDQIKVIEIADNGQGVPTDKVDQIFVPFFTTKAEGTGIGLSLSRQIMHLHGGSILYRANQPRGSKFILQFN